MLQHQDYEKFVIQTFQDSFTGSALDWFMTLKTPNIPTLTDLSQKFLNRYRYCAETPLTLLDLSMIEMEEDQTFEAYTAEWRGKAAKHIPTLVRDIRLREKIQEMINAKEISFNEVKPPNVRANPLPNHGSSLGPVINMVSICAIGKEESVQESPISFVIKYVTAKITVASAPFIIKKVTKDEAEDFTKIIKASEYKVMMEQMGKSPAHISLLALLLSFEPHREAVLKVFTAAQILKETATDRIEETINSIFSNQISFTEDELPFEGYEHCTLFASATTT
ncbi:hypothetical protein CRG98_012113 [Punica granatum]|uniref:Retrotransposon gag domain-containing protein n=1 Tax=Punica granatum TaxID=22663 RepID=A0A2I0KGA5_PUNGR|nr:hypothetical protein CRG98_012113 [Punica granatum]